MAVTVVLHYIKLQHDAMLGCFVATWSRHKAGDMDRQDEVSGFYTPL